MAAITKVPTTKKTGPKTVRWRALVRRNGVVESKTFDRKSDAVDWANATEAAIKAAATELQGLASAAPSIAGEGALSFAQLKEEVAIAKGEHVGSRHTTFDALVRRYDEQCLQRSTNQQAARETRLRLSWWAQELARQVGRGPLTLARIRPSHIVAAKEVLEATPFKRSNKPDAVFYERTPATINRYLAALGALFSKAVEWQLIERNVMRGAVKRCSENNKRQRFLSDDERERLLQACAASDWPGLLPFVLVALCSGARRGEIIGLRWSDVDLRSGRASLAKTKNGDPRTIAIVGRALDELRALKLKGGGRSEFVFASPAGAGSAYWAMDSYWREALRAAEIEGFRMHDLRHSCASYLAAGGASLLEISKVLGHRSMQTTARYSHLLDSHAHGLVERMAREKNL